MTRIGSVRKGDGFVIGGTFCAVESLIPHSQVALVVTEDIASRLLVPLDLIAQAVKGASRYEISAAELAAWSLCPACGENVLMPGWKVCSPCRQPVETQEATP